METVKKLSKKEFAARVESYQEAYPNQTLYFTEDGNCFLKKSPAIDHSNKTKQKWFEIPSGADAAVKAKEDEKKDADETGKNDAKAEAEKQLAEIEITDETDYALAKELVSKLGIVTKSNKKDDILFALAEYKESLKKAE